MHGKMYLLLNYLARSLAWCTAIIYITIETKYALEAQDFLNITTFAVLFLLASMQFSISRYLQRSEEKALAESTFYSGIAMAYAALFDLFDACIDEFIRRFQPIFLLAQCTYFLHLISWIVTVLAAILAVISLDKFLHSMKKITLEKNGFQSSKTAIAKTKARPAGSREPRRRILRK